jgi:dephospho-CoA kinase
MARVIVLTGGIGAGKSTAAARLAALGARVIDADTVAKAQLDEPSVAVAVVEAFGADVTRPGGGIDRMALAALVFDDIHALARLEAIVHPATTAALLAQIEAAGPDEVLAIEIPLPAAVPEVVGRADAVVAIEADPATRLDRCVARGMDRGDARRRLELQPTDAERRRFATDIVANETFPASLEAAMDAVWELVTGRRPGVDR